MNGISQLKKKKSFFCIKPAKDSEGKTESKELHMNLLRQYSPPGAGETGVRSAMLERDEANATIRKLQKKVERLQKELSVCRELEHRAQAKRLDTNELKASAHRMCFLVTVCVSIKIYAKEWQPYKGHT